MKTLSTRSCAFALAIATLSFSTASAELIRGIATVGGASALMTWDSANPRNILSSKFIGGLTIPGSGDSDSIVGIDFRPSTGQLYALTSSGTIGFIDTSNGAAHIAWYSGQALDGFSFGFDFNPTIDRIRAVAETNKNRVYDPVTNSVALLATDLAYGPGDPNFGTDPNVVHSAYNNNFPGAPTSQLFGIDSSLDILVTQANNTGVLGTIGPLGVDVTAIGGFDISGQTGIAYATMMPVGSSQSYLYTINLTTGAATLVDQIDGGVMITAMSVDPQIPEPTTVALAAMAIAAIPLVRRRNG